MTKPCDACQAGNAVIYCRADTAYLCSGCDNKVHCANKLASRHERVLVCEVCEHAPAAVTCKADAASLCVTCDNDIHSANPLARRHERVPITPFFDAAVAKFEADGNGNDNAAAAAANHEQQECSLLLKEDDEEEESSAAEAASWLLPHPATNVGLNLKNQDGEEEEENKDHEKEEHDFGNESKPPATTTTTTTSTITTTTTTTTENNNFYSMKAAPAPGKEKPSKPQQNFDLFSDMDPYLDMDFVSALGALQPEDSLVPIHATEVLSDSSPVASNGSESYDMELEQKPGHNFCPDLSLSTSSIDVGVVPDASLNDISTPQSRPTMSVFDLPQRGPPLHHATPLEPMAREARVLRYREKRKNRKFEKTIRYASRKAYAETRPRIKGRFAKRSEMEVEQMYAVVPDSSFGVVPSF